MPCGCECCGHGFCFGHLMYILEKIAAFCAMTAIISCIIVTVIVSIGLGVGIGYNYCFVDMKTTKLSAADSFKSGSPQSPGRPSAHPFSGESSNETEITTFINHPVSQSDDAEIPTFPSVPEIPNIPYIPQYPGGPGGSGSDSGVPNLLGQDSITDAPGGSVFISDSPIHPSGHGSVTSISSDPGHSPDLPKNPGDQGSGTHFVGGTESDPDLPNLPGGQDSFPGIPSGRESSSNSPDDDPRDQGAINDKHNLSDDQVSIFSMNAEQIPNPNVLRGREYFSNIPQSPNFPGSFRRIPINNSRVGPVAFVLRPGDKMNARTFKVASVTGRQRKEFEEFRKGIKANAKNIDKGSDTTEIEDEYSTVEAENDQTVAREKYRRRKPVQNKKHNKVRKTTSFMPTIVIPLKKYANMSPLISKILAQNKNVTLQFITL